MSHWLTPFMTRPGAPPVLASGVYYPYRPTNIFTIVISNTKFANLMHITCLATIVQPAKVMEEPFYSKITLMFCEEHQNWSKNDN